jgi:hypothetical protein
MTRCPILSKLQQAAAIISKGQAHSPAALSPTSVLLEGSHGSYVHIDYDSGAAGINLNFVLNGTSAMVDQMAKNSPRAVPTWAPNDDVKCHAKLLEAFNSFISPLGGKQPSLLETMLFLAKVCLPPSHARVVCLSRLRLLWVEQVAVTVSRAVAIWAPIYGVECHAKLLEAFNWFISPWEDNSHAYWKRCSSWRRCGLPLSKS